VVFADGKAAGMLGFADEPSEPLMGHGHRSARRSTFALLGGLGVCALMLVAGLQLWAPAPSTLWVPPETVLDEDEVRKALHTFVSSLSSEESAKLYFSNASLQPEQWELCTIVQQCPVPKYGMAVGLLSPQKRTHIYNILALVLSDEAYKRILVQQLSNMLLGEMQTWRSAAQAAARSSSTLTGCCPTTCSRRARPSPPATTSTSRTPPRTSAWPPPTAGSTCCGFATTSLA